MANINHAITLKHRSNLGEAIEDVSFEEGEEVTLLKEWADRCLCKNADGQLFNIPKQYVDA